METQKPQKPPIHQKPAPQDPATTTNTPIIREQQPASIKTNDYRDNSSSEQEVNILKQFQQSPKQILKTYKTSSGNKNNSSTTIALAKPGIVAAENAPVKMSLETTKQNNQQSTFGNDVINDTAISSQPSINDSIATPLIEKKVVPENIVIDSTLKKKVAVNKKWNKQINLILGGSSYASGLSLSNKSAAQDALYSIGSGTGTSTGGIVNNNFVPAPTEGGFGFSIGFDINWRSLLPND